MTVAIVVPLDPATLNGDGERVKPYSFVRQHLDLLDVQVVPGVCGGEWRKSAAVADGLRWLKDADMLILHDADVIVPLHALQRAVYAITDGVAEWAMPHNLVHRLDDVSTIATLQSGSVPSTHQLVRWPYVGMIGGGVVVMRRATYDDCPLDPRFVGWGSEDQSWGFALETLHGPPWRGDADLYHLWHPHPEPGATRSPRFASERLRRAYRAYRSYPERMRALVDEARVCG